MKTMTCKQLGGVCDKEFSANTFEEMGALSKKHGMEMFQKGDSEHISAMEKMMEKMKNPSEMEKWLETKQKEFDSSPDN